MSFRRTLLLNTLIGSLVFLTLSCMTAPRTSQKKFVHEIHGDKRMDHYHWLRDEERKNPEVIEHLNKENDRVDSYLSGTQGLQKELFDQMVSRMKEDDSEVPYFYKGYYYYSRTEKAKNHRIYCRRKGSMDSREQVMLDLNKLAKEKKNVKLGSFSVSPDQNILAYAIDEMGKEIYTLYFKDLRTNRVLGEKIEKIAPGTVWAADNRHIFYTKMNKAFRLYKSFRYELGNPKSETLLFTEKDELFDLDFSKSLDGQYIFLSSGSFTSSEVRFIPADKPKSSWTFIQRRVPKLEYSVEHHKGFFFILNNLEATNFKISKAPVAKPYMSQWEDVISHNSEALILDIHVQKERLVYLERRDGLKRIKFINHGSIKGEELKFNEAVYTVSLDANPEYDSDHLRISFQSPVTPPIVYHYDFNKKEYYVKKQKEVPNFDASVYATSRLMVSGRDKAKIPVTLVHKKDFKKDGKAPLLLYGYGSYGYTIDPTFSITRLSLVDRGFIFAIAHVRGSQAKGRTWYNDGKLNKKKNTFNDFVDVAKVLVSDNFTSADRLVARGGSAGGLLMGAVANQAPEAFAGIVAEVPFVDVVTTILDPNLRFSVQEYQQWGNPNIKTDYDYMMSYSPYDNVRKVDYPDFFVAAGLYDSRVNYWEPAKWVAKLREHDTGGATILLRTNMDAGHSGSSGRYDSIKEEAEVQAFILKTVGKD